MKTPRLIVTALVIGATALAVVALAGTRTRKAASQADRVERGRYLTQLGGCIDCHTPGTFYGEPDLERHLSGSEVGWEGPWGVTYPRNLTPDMETGIGTWSEEDIVRAIRAGMRPDGSVIQPPMPWPNYGGLSDEDAYAIAAYLKSLPPVKHRVPAALPPGSKARGAALILPAPPAWDAPRGAAAAAAHGQPQAMAK